MKKSPQPLRRPASFQRGFALIATLSMMILLTLIAVGLLSLSTVTIRSGKAEADLAIARANARLAMMQALSELQRLAGPDQRVTATASLLETPDSSGNITSPAINPHWTGVWRTDRYGRENPFLTAEACERLVGAGAAFVGIDSVNIDDIADLARPAHTILLAAGIPICEHMTNLAALPAQGGRLHAVPIAWRGGATFPVRAYVQFGAESG